MQRFHRQDVLEAYYLALQDFGPHWRLTKLLRHFTPRREIRITNKYQDTWTAVEQLTGNGQEIYSSAVDQLISDQMSPDYVMDSGESPQSWGDYR